MDKEDNRRRRHRAGSHSSSRRRHHRRDNEDEEEDSGRKEDRHVEGENRRRKHDDDDDHHHDGNRSRDRKVGRKQDRERSSRRGGGGGDSDEGGKSDTGDGKKERSGRRHVRDRRHRRRDRDGDDSDDSRRRHRKKRKRSRRSDDGSNSDSGGDDSIRGDKERKRKHEKSKKSDRKRKHKKESVSRDSSKKRSQSKAPDKKLLVPLGDVRGKPSDHPLDADRDYFSFHQHFWVYLFREEGVAFNDLTSDEARESFRVFSRRYNSGELEAAYYDPGGLPPAALEESKTTRHSWSFRTSQRENETLHVLQEGVRKQTEFRKKKGASDLPPRDESGAGGIHPLRDDRPRRTAEDRFHDRVAGRRLREHVRASEEELSGGKKDGRELQIEKRKELSARIHGAARDREDPAVELTDAAIYGGGGGGGKGDVDFQEALSRERRHKARREEQRRARVSELQAKEDNKQEAMLKRLGLSNIKPGEKIKIQPRNNG